MGKRKRQSKSVDKGNGMYKGKGKCKGKGNCDTYRYRHVDDCIVLDLRVQLQCVVRVDFVPQAKARARALARGVDRAHGRCCS